MYQALPWTNWYKINEMTLLIQPSGKERFYQAAHIGVSPSPTLQILSLFIPLLATRVLPLEATWKILSLKVSRFPHVGAKKELRYPGYYALFFNRVLLFSGVSWESIIMGILIIYLEMNFRLFLTAVLLSEFSDVTFYLSSNTENVKLNSIADNKATATLAYLLFPFLKQSK